MRERANAVLIDPRSDAVVAVRDASSMGLAERWVHSADPLHFGNFAGLGVKLLWAAFGLVLCLLALSGAQAYAKRTAQSVRAGARRAAASHLPHARPG